VLLLSPDISLRHTQKVDFATQLGLLLDTIAKDRIAVKVYNANYSFQTNVCWDSGFTPRRFAMPDKKEPTVQPEILGSTKKTSRISVAKVLANNDSNHLFYIRTSPGRNILWIAANALIYFLVAHFSLLLIFKPEGIAAIWPSSGIFLSSLLLTRRELRPWLVGVLFATDFVCEMLAGTPVGVSLIYALTLSADAVLSAWLLLRFVGGTINFKRIRELFGWLLLSVLLSNAFTSLLAAAASQALPGPSFWISWREWASSDGVGNLIVTPLVLGWAAYATSWVKGWRLKRLLEGTALLLLLALVDILAFSRLAENGLFSVLLIYLVFPFLIWAALRFGVRGVATATLLVSGITVYYAYSGHFIDVLFPASQLNAVVAVQVYLAIMAIPALILATVMTERRQAETDLRESQKLLQDITDNTPSLIYALDKQGKFILVNRRLESILGAPRANIIGQTRAAFLPPEIADAHHINDLQVLAEQKPMQYEEENDEPDGKHTYFSVKFPLTDPRGNLYGISGISNDITDRKRVEEEIKRLNVDLEQRVEERTHELREAQEQLVRHEKLAVLGQLAGSVGHELRNPLGIINSAIYYLKLIQPDASDKIMEYHTKIEQEVHNADKIISDLLDFSRFKSVDRENVSVPELVQRLLVRFPVPDLFKTVLELPADIPMVFADPRQMEQVLGNLTINACQAMPEGGKLTISASVQNEFVAIAVKDTGKGIPPENMSKLFEPLFTTKPRGIGLGLAVSKKLAEANDGRIEVKSKAGEGSTFLLFLPVHGKER
jgi:PAS domain S-box-containing protein